MTTTCRLCNNAYGKPAKNSISGYCAYCQKKILEGGEVGEISPLIHNEHLLSERYYGLLVKALREDDWESQFMIGAGDTFGSYRNSKHSNIHFRIQCGIGLIGNAEVYVDKKEVMSFPYSWPFTELNKEVKNMKKRMKNKQVAERNDVARKAMEVDIN